MSRFGRLFSKDGIIVYYVDDSEEGYPSVYPLKNFGDYQSDSYEYMKYDCPKLEEAGLLKLTIKNYNPADKWKRLGYRNYRKQKDAFD